MSNQEDLRPMLRRKAADVWHQLSGSEREALLIKCWMSHDARWFAAAAQECGLEVANRLNQTAAHEIGKVEARRIARALQLPPVTALDSVCSSITPTPTANGPTTATHTSAVWIGHWMKRTSAAGRSWI